MKLQSSTVGCGPAAVANALQALGWDVSQETAWELADADGDGANASKLKRAAAKLGAKVGSISRTSESDAWFELLGRVNAGQAVVLLFDNGKHWVTAVGTHGSTVIVVDPAMSVRQHVEHMSREELCAAWRYGSRKVHYYAIALSRDEDE